MEEEDDYSKGENLEIFLVGSLIFPGHLCPANRGRRDKASNTCVKALAFQAPNKGPFEAQYKRQSLLFEV